MGLFNNKGAAEKVTVAGKELICPICGHNQFFSRDTQLNTTMMTFFDLDWANANATNYICDNCGYMFWFFPVE